jgi:uncharacterized membrane protein
MGYTKGFWIGIIFFIIGILMILLGSPPQLELLGSVCPIAGFMWAIAEKVSSPVVGILRELHNDHATLHKDHQEILKALRRRSRA